MELLASEYCARVGPRTRSNVAAVLRMDRDRSVFRLGRPDQDRTWHEILVSVRNCFPSGRGGGLAGNRSTESNAPAAFSGRKEPGLHRPSVVPHTGPPVMVGGTMRCTPNSGAL